MNNQLTFELLQQGKTEAYIGENNILTLNAAITNTTGSTRITTGDFPVEDDGNYTGVATLIFMGGWEHFLADPGIILIDPNSAWKGTYYPKTKRWGLIPKVSTSLSNGQHTLITLQQIDIATSVPQQTVTMSMTYWNFPPFTTSPFPGIPDREPVLIIDPASSGNTPLRKNVNIQAVSDNKLILISPSRQGTYDNNLFRFLFSNSSSSGIQGTSIDKPKPSTIQFTFIAGGLPGVGAMAKLESLQNLNYYQLSITQDGGNIGRWKKLPRQALGGNVAWTYQLNAGYDVLFPAFENVVFQFDNMATYLNAGYTDLYIQWRNIPGYADGNNALPLVKALARIENFNTSFRSPQGKVPVGTFAQLVLDWTCTEGVEDGLLTVLGEEKMVPANFSGYIINLEKDNFLTPLTASLQAQAADTIFDEKTKFYSWKLKSFTSSPVRSVTQGQASKGTIGQLTLHWASTDDVESCVLKGNGEALTLPANSPEEGYVLNLQADSNNQLPANLTLQSRFNNTTLDQKILSLNWQKTFKSTEKIAQASRLYLHTENNILVASKETIDSVGINNGNVWVFKVGNDQISLQQPVIRTNSENGFSSSEKPDHSGIIIVNSTKDVVEIDLSVHPATQHIIDIPSDNHDPWCMKILSNSDYAILLGSEYIVKRQFQKKVQLYHINWQTKTATLVDTILSSNFGLALTATNDGMLAFAVEFSSSLDEFYAISSYHIDIDHGKLIQSQTGIQVGAFGWPSMYGGAVYAQTFANNKKLLLHYFGMNAAVVSIDHNGIIQPDQFVELNTSGYGGAYGPFMLMPNSNTIDIYPNSTEISSTPIASIPTAQNDTITSVAFDPEKFEFYYVAGGYVYVLGQLIYSSWAQSYLDRANALHLSYNELPVYDSLEALSDNLPISTVHNTVSLATTLSKQIASLDLHGSTASSSVKLVSKTSNEPRSPVRQSKGPLSFSATVQAYEFSDLDHSDNDECDGHRLSTATVHASPQSTSDIHTALTLLESGQTQTLSTTTTSVSNVVHPAGTVLIEKAPMTESSRVTPQAEQAAEFIALDPMVPSPDGTDELGQNKLRDHAPCLSGCCLRFFSSLSCRRSVDNTKGIRESEEEEAHIVANPGECLLS